MQQNNKHPKYLKTEKTSLTTKPELSTADSSPVMSSSTLKEAVSPDVQKFHDQMDDTRSNVGKYNPNPGKSTKYKGYEPPTVQPTSKVEVTEKQVGQFLKQLKDTNIQPGQQEPSLTKYKGYEPPKPEKSYSETEEEKKNNPQKVLKQMF